MVFDAAFVSIQHYKVRIKGKVEQSWEWSSAPLHLDIVAIEKGEFGSPSTKVINFTFLPLSYLFFMKIWKKQWSTRSLSS